jgi:hypothetical protein
MCQFYNSKQVEASQLNGHICILVTVSCKDLQNVSLHIQLTPAQSEFVFIFIIFCGSASQRGLWPPR